MSALPAPNDLVLVAYLPSPRDLEIAKVLGWYRIPLRTAPRVVSVDYIAFYQPAAFGEEHKWCIEYVAEVRGHELATREELFKDEMDHSRAGDEYFKLQLGPVQSLPSPIPAGDWKRLTFLFTTGDLLSKADTVNDLVLPAEERSTVYRALRDRARAANTYGSDLPPEFPIDSEILAFFGMRGSGAAYFDSSS
ncbi:MAG: hypothetical protein ACRDFQ_01605 [Anaerolineales bacterium]